MSIKYSCVVENNQNLHAQCFVWINCLRELAGVKQEDIFVHTVGAYNDPFTEWIKSQGINRVVITPFASTNRYCNKLNQLDTFVSRDDFDYVVLLDCDVCVTTLENLNLESDVYGKIVDFPQPPFPILCRIFSAAGLGEPSKSQSTFAHKGNQTTDYNNCNGGVYIISKGVIGAISREWIHYANWSLQNADLYGKDFSKHIDQVSFALALRKLGIKVNHLSIEWNFPTHVDRKLLPNVSPRIIHYHWQMNEHLKLIPTGWNNVDQVIDLINRVIAVCNRKHFNNKLFWNTRYMRFPELGSGVGSRGNNLELKRLLIANSIHDTQTKSVIDVGCGDLEVLKVFVFKSYLGIDVSENALEIARGKRSNWNFACGDIRTMKVEAADVLICLDVLIHQPSEEDYKSLIDRMVEVCTDRLIIGAYNDRPSTVSEITFFYEPIVKTLEATGRFVEINVAGTYRDVSLVVAVKDRRGSHQRDISHMEYNLAANLVERGDLLRRLVDLSRSRLGFFTKHATRTIEYTWLADKMEGDLDRKRVLDVGSGVSPLPLHFAERGAKVLTVDLHKVVRKIEDKSDWNEWGFLNYAIIDRRIISYNVDVLRFRTLRRMDVIYSISVIEHVPQRQRVKILKKIQRLLKKDGRVYLSIDLIPGTNNIWTYSEGKEIESSGVHGSIATLNQEIEDSLLEVVSSNVRRNIPNSRTDILLIELKRR